MNVRIIQGGIILFIYTIYFSLNISHVQLEHIRALGALSLFQLIYIYYSWYKEEHSLLNGYIIFISAFYAFNLGQPILECFNMVAEQRSLIEHHMIPLKNIFEATYIGTLFILFLHFGALFSIRSSSKNNYIPSSIDVDRKILAIQKVARYFCFMTMPLYLYQILSNISIVLLYGYNALYDPNLNSTPKIISLIADFYEPSVIALFFAAQYFRRHTKLIAILALITIFLPPIILGGRSNAMIILSIFLIVYSLFHTITKKKVVALLAVLFILFSAFAVVAVTRGDANKSLSNYESVYKEMDNPVATTFSEMGFSMYPLCKCLDIVPSKEDYRYGESFLYSFTSIIPNLGFWKEHPARLHANLGEWLMRYLNLSFGPGFSLTAEAYVNFGYLGFAFFFLYGLILSKSFKYINRKYIDVNPFVLVACLVFLWFSIKTVRNSFLGTVRALFYYSLPMYWMFKYYYNKIKIR